MHKFSVTVAVTGDELKVGFGSTLDQGTSDESWGIDNLKIKAALSVDEYINNSMSPANILEAVIPVTTETISGIENIIGTDNDDVFLGSDANVKAGAGNDYIFSGNGANAFDGGEGLDVVDYSTSDTGVTVNLNGEISSGGTAEGDTLINIENIIGSDHDDTLTGDSSANIIKGGAGIDKVIIAGSVSEFTLTREGSKITVSRIGADEVDILFDVETLSFDDQDIDVLSAFPEGASGDAILPIGRMVSGQVYSSDVQTPISEIVYALESRPEDLKGMITINADGTYSYQAAIGFTGTEVIRFRVTDGDGFSDVRDLSVTVFEDRYIGGAETIVNSFTSGEQSAPAIASLPNGGHVIVWRSNGQDGSSWGVYGQRFNASGNPVGDEFRVNTGTSSEQRDPSITALADGGFVVVWHSYAQDGSSWGVYGQHFDASGNTVGGEFQVNSYTSGEQSWPSISALSDGGFVATWQSSGQDGSSYGIYGQRFDAFANSIDNEFRINTYTSNDQSRPVVTSLSEGGFVVVWRSAGQDGSSWGVYGQRFDASGFPVGTEFRLNTRTSNEQRDPSITALVDGGFVVAWHSYAQDGSSWGVYGQHFDASGNTVGEEFQINSYT